MFNPHIHQQQQQQQQQFQQHLRQLQQLFQQQPPPPPPPQPPPGHHVAHHHHQTPRAMPVPPQSAPPPRMVNLCQATQTTIIAPNPMLQGALLMQQMQGNMRSFGMGGQQQFRQFFAASARSSLLGPVPMGMAIKSPIMGFPAARPFHPHARYYNNTTTTASSSSSSFPSITTTEAAARQPDRKRDSEQMATETTDDQPAAGSTNETTEIIETEMPGGVDEPVQSTGNQLEEPAIKRQRTEGSEELKEHKVIETITIADTDEEVLSSDRNIDTDLSHPDDVILEEEGCTRESDVVEALEEGGAAEVLGCLSAPSPSGGLTEDDQQVNVPLKEDSEGKDSPLVLPDNQEEGEEGGAENANKFYCYLCSITCHNQQNFRSHMNSVSHQQRMMEIQHMSNACLVTLLPRVQESLMGANKDGEKKDDSKHWCATCHNHFTSSITDHRRTEEHKLASRTAISSCTVCKKHFRTSQIFVEHLQSVEHRQKVEKLQEREGCEVLGNLTATDADGFSVEEGEEIQLGDGEQIISEKLDDWPSFKEVTLKEMTCDEQHNPNTIYGSSFFVPVAGFICRVCHKFYHFESSALHSHCKSLKHFEKLKKYKELLSQKEEAAASSGESLGAPDNIKPGTEATTDHLDESPHCDDAGLVTDVNSTQTVCSLTQINSQTGNQRLEELAVPDQTSQDFTTSPSRGEEATSQACVVQGQLADLPTGSREDPQRGATAKEGDEELEEEEAAAAPGKKIDSGKAKATPKRRSGRVANRR
ncbi:cdkn1a interacting zinc finger protein 1a [Antennarius striatus]|uniref:cdkn1a interacting zinc finger protein 1a n=1 Tax=Antennarius striatus TaxID=241820 RepID=UPI0035B1DA00